jgi:hypothetical protein
MLFEIFPLQIMSVVAAANHQSAWTPANAGLSWKSSQEKR